MRPELAAVKGSSPQPKAALLGILHSYIPYTDGLISQQTGDVYSIMKENSGLTNVHPVDYIKQTVLIERQRVGDVNISRYEMLVPTEQPQVNPIPLTDSPTEENKPAPNTDTTDNPKNEMDIVDKQDTQTKSKRKSKE